MLGFSSMNLLMTSMVALARSSPPHQAKRKVTCSLLEVEAAVLVEAAPLVLSAAGAALLAALPPHAARDNAMLAAIIPAKSCFFILFSSF